jgi:putative flippase GtrA
VSPEPLLQRMLRFGRALIVGSGASLADFSVFEACVRAAGISPSWARLPALLTGACCQFFGNRGYTFRARAGDLSRQAQLFLLAESITLGLNWSVFHLLVTHASGVPPELLSFLGTFVVFIAFAYPVRRWVIFRLPR